MVDPIALFKGLTSALASGIELLAAVIIGLAVIEAVVRTGWVFLHPDLPPAAKEKLRLRLGRWLAVALEFELGADILRTAIAPSWSDIGMLAAIAAIRTGLNYVLDLEIQRAARNQTVTTAVVGTQPEQAAASGAVQPRRSTESIENGQANREPAAT